MQSHNKLELKRECIVACSWSVAASVGTACHLDELTILSTTTMLKRREKGHSKHTHTH